MKATVGNITKYYKSPDTLLFCYYCGDEYSANPGDYWDVDPNSSEPLLCECGAPLELLARRTFLVDPTPSTSFRFSCSGDPDIEIPSREAIVVLNYQPFNDKDEKSMMYALQEVFSDIFDEPATATRVYPAVQADE